MSLVSSLDKIITNVLSLKLREILESTISLEQATFVRGIKILNVALVAYKVVEEYKRANKEGWIFKIDFEHVYDHVDWDFLNFGLKEKGFGNNG